MPANDRFRILQVCSAREAIYGAVQSLMTLSEAQRRAGHEVEFLTFKGKRFGAQVRERGFPVHEVKVRSKIDPLAILEMRRLMQHRRYDVVHTHLSTSSVNGTLAARLAGVPCLSTVHGMSGKLSFAAADHLIAVSEQVKAHLVFQGVPADKVSVVYNGLDLQLSDLDRDAAKRALGLDTEGPVLGTVSRVTPMKGIEDAIRAVALLKPEFPQIQYLVVGDGDALESCRNLTRDLRLEPNVKFVGYQEAIGPYLAAMDLFLFPSHKEAMGIALVEAMAAGLATVATDIGGIPEVVTPEVGLLRPAHNPQALAAATRDLLVNEPLRREMEAAAKERAQTVFSASAMERTTDWVYRSLLGLGLRLPTETAGAKQPV